jgi:hypothetical protein
MLSLVFLSVPYSRYFNTHIAEAITSCGRHTIKSGEKFCNDLLNDPTDELLDVFPYRTGLEKIIQKIMLPI